jgi:hypothetical protein
MTRQTKPDVTLQPSKRVVVNAAAQIFSAYIAAGHAQKESDSEKWIKRALSEAVTIARTVQTAVLSDAELPDEGEHQLREQDNSA